MEHPEQAEQTEHEAKTGWPIVPCADPAAFEAWLDEHHTTDPGVWVRLAKKGRGLTTITLAEATEVACCFGWVDVQNKRYDDDYYLLRYQPRRPQGNWTPRNRAIAERLVAEGRMRPAGLAAMEAGRAAGRWETT